MSESRTDPGEISLGDLVRRVWAGRALIVVLVLLGAGVGALYAGLSALTQPRPAVHLVYLRNIENQSYPNGSAFSPQDLLIPQVVEALRAQFAIPPETDLRGAIRVAYESPLAAGIQRQYQQRLAARTLTPADIAAINEAYLAELQGAMRSSLSITVDYDAAGADAQTGLAMAAALPAIWSEVYTTQFRIFTDNRLAALAFSRDAEDLASTASVLAADARLAAMTNGLAIMVEDNRLALLRTPDALTPADLAYDVSRYRTSWFNPIRATGLQSGDTVASTYLTELRLDIDDLTRRVEAYDAALADIRSYQRGVDVAPLAPGAIARPAEVATDRAADVQLGESALSRIVELAGEASFAGFVEETLNERRLLTFRISELTRQLQLAGQDTPVSTVIPAEFRTNAATRLAELTTDYAALVDLASDQLQGRGEQLYEPALGPYLPGAFVTPRNLLAILVGALAGGLLGFILVFLRPMIGAPRPADPARAS